MWNTLLFNRFKCFQSEHCLEELSQACQYVIPKEDVASFSWCGFLFRLTLEIINMSVITEAHNSTLELSAFFKADWLYENFTLKRWSVDAKVVWNFLLRLAENKSNFAQNANSFIQKCPMRQDQAIANDQQSQKTEQTKNWRK